LQHFIPRGATVAARHFDHNGHGRRRHRSSRSLA
jgi:hypothetical protein